MALAMLLLALLDLLLGWLVLGIALPLRADDSAAGRWAVRAGLLMLLMAAAALVAAWAWYRGWRRAEVLTFAAIGTGVLLAWYQGQRPAP